VRGREVGEEEEEEGSARASWARGGGRRAHIDELEDCCGLDVGIAALDLLARLVERLVDDAGLVVLARPQRLDEACAGSRESVWSSS